MGVHMYVYTDNECVVKMFEIGIKYLLNCFIRVQAMAEGKLAPAVIKIK
ncbi:hypothetical protein NSMS1_12410 [Nostoc sp. MS1]|nr:hypothetical protein NSMS1_12410 [Nostoc sp. MS1]